MTITLIILAGAVLLFLSGRLRPDLIALLVVVSLGVTGILTPQEAFSGFSRSAVITVMAIYVLAEGLQLTGITDKVGSLLLKLAGSEKRWLMVTVMISGAFLSLFMNNIAAASVLMPAVSGASRKSEINPSRLLMPLAIGTILGGMATLLTTANIIVSSLLRDAGYTGFGLLDFAPLGLPLVATGILFMATVGWRLLPKRSSIRQHHTMDQEEGDLSNIYRLDERLIMARIPNGSDLIGKTLGQSNLRQEYHLNLVSLEHASKKLYLPSPEVTFSLGDVLLLEGKPEDVSLATLHPNLEFLQIDKSKGYGLESQKVSLVEVILAPRSTLIGQTLRSTHFREKYDLNVIAIWRSGRPIRTELSDLRLQFGDACLVQGERERVKVLHSEPDLIILNGEDHYLNPKGGKGWLALLIMVITLFLAASNLIPVAEAMLAGALVMVLAGIITMDRAYQVIDWKSVFLIAGMLPMGIALAKSGAATNLGDWMISVLGPFTPMVFLVGLVVLTLLFSQVMNGAAVAAVVAPVAIVAAQKLGVDPRSMVMGVAMAASMTFLSPLGHPVNMLVMGPGSYRFQDFIKVGLPLTVVLLIVMICLFPYTWPLTSR